MGSRDGARVTFHGAAGRIRSWLSNLSMVAGRLNRPASVVIKATLIARGS